MANRCAKTFPDRVDVREARGSKKSGLIGEKWARILARHFSKDRVQLELARWRGAICVAAKFFFVPKKKITPKKPWKFLGGKKKRGARAGPKF